MRSSDYWVKFNGHLFYCILETLLLILSDASIKTSMPELTTSSPYATTRSIDVPPYIPTTGEINNPMRYAAYRDQILRAKYGSSNGEYGKDMIWNAPGYETAKPITRVSQKTKKSDFERSGPRYIECGGKAEPTIEEQRIEWNKDFEIPHHKDDDYWDDHPLSEIIRHSFPFLSSSSIVDQDLINREEAYGPRKKPEASVATFNLDDKFVTAMFDDEAVSDGMSSLIDLVVALDKKRPVQQRMVPRYHELEKNLGRILKEFGIKQSDTLRLIDVFILVAFRFFDEEFKVLKKKVNGKYVYDEEHESNLLDWERKFLYDYKNVKSKLAMAIFNRVISYRKDFFNLADIDETKKCELMGELLFINSDDHGCLE